MAYETDILNPSWWINSLIGSWTLFFVILQLWLLTFIRRIANVRLFAVVLLSLNGLLLFYGIWQGEGSVMNNSLLTLMILIFAFIIWGGSKSS